MGTGILFAPSRTQIGEFERVGEIVPHGNQHGFPGIDVAIRTGHNDESKDILDLQE